MQFYGLLTRIFHLRNFSLCTCITSHASIPVYIYHFSIFNFNRHQAAVSASGTGNLDRLHRFYSSFAQ